MRDWMIEIEPSCDELSWNGMIVHVWHLRPSGDIHALKSKLMELFAFEYSISYFFLLLRFWFHFFYLAVVVLCFLLTMTTPFEYKMRVVDQIHCQNVSNVSQCTNVSTRMTVSLILLCVCPLWSVVGVSRFCIAWKNETANATRTWPLATIGG